jgi:hypothetical protein
MNLPLKTSVNLQDQSTKLHYINILSIDFSIAQKISRVGAVPRHIGGVVAMKKADKIDNIRGIKFLCNFEFLPRTSLQT